MFGALFNDSEIEAFFTDEAIIRAMLRFEAALVLAQADAKAIPFDHGHLTAWERLPRMPRSRCCWSSLGKPMTAFAQNSEPGFNQTALNFWLSALVRCFSAFVRN
jgi:hypothetical protein